MALKHISLVTILVTFCLLSLGGVVHNTESSLACPDWPFCYAGFAQDADTLAAEAQAKGSSFYKISHRFLASLAGILNILLLFFSYQNWQKTRSPQFLRAFRLSVLALFFILVQGAIGGITVLYELPTMVSTTHFAFSIIYLCVMILLDHELRYFDQTGWSERHSDYKIFQKQFGQYWQPLSKHLLYLGLVVLYFQMLLGAFVRHVGAGAACGVGPGTWNLCVEASTWSSAFWPNSHPAEIHMSHRLFALVTFAIVSFVCLSLFRQLRFFNIRAFSSHFTWIKPILLLIPIGLLLQMGLGVATVYWKLAIIPTTFHLLVAATVFALLWKSYLLCGSLEKYYKFGPSHSFLSDLVELAKPRLAGLVMMTVLVGLALAPESINFFKALLALGLIFLVVAGAASLNCYIERDIDLKMERTRERALPSGRLSSQFALVFGVSILSLATLGLAFWINILTAFLGLLAALLYLLAYTPLKQKTPLAVYVGAIPGAIPPVMGWTTVMGEMSLLAWLLFFILFAWQLPHFLAISIYNARDYDAAAIRVYPNTLGVDKTVQGIFWLTLVLGVVAILPGVWEQASRSYTIVAVALSVAISLYALRAFFVPKLEETINVWARRYFLATVAYLPLLLGAMIFLK